MVRECAECGKVTNRLTRNMCSTCYARWFRNQPGVRDRHAEVERNRRKRLGEIYREYERERRKQRAAQRKVYQATYYAENAEALRQYQRDWRRNNPEQRDEYKRRRRARVRGLEDTLTLDEWSDILESTHHACIYCGAMDVELVKEHWIPADRGGGYTKENIVPACRLCNARKGTRTGDEFMDQIDDEEWEDIVRVVVAYESFHGS